MKKRRRCELHSHRRRCLFYALFFLEKSKKSGKQNTGVGGALFAMYVANAQAKVFTSTMTYEILLIVVIGGIGSVSGSVIGTFLYVACSEWWLRFLDRETYIGSFKVPLLRSGFRMVVFSVVIMIIVLFFSKGIMGEKELSWKGIGGLLKKRKKAAPAAEKED